MVVALVAVALVRIVPPLNVFVPEKTLVVVVLNAVLNTPVDELNASGYVADKEVELILLLKRLQSVEVRSPRLEADADGRLKVKTPPLLVMEKSLPVVEVASVMAPTWPVPYVCATEVTAPEEVR